MLVVDRSSFRAWAQGVLLDRDAEGRCIVGDNADHDEAERRMEAGETVLLVVNGVVVSTMRLKDGSYTEEVYMQGNGKIEKMKVGQVWKSNDPREAYVDKVVVEVNGDEVTLARPTGRRQKVSQEKFLKRQGQKHGYSLVSE